LETGGLGETELKKKQDQRTHKPKEEKGKTFGPRAKRQSGKRMGNKKNKGFDYWKFATARGLNSQSQRGVRTRRGGDHVGQRSGCRKIKTNLQKRRQVSQKKRGGNRRQKTKKRKIRKKPNYTQGHQGGNRGGARGLEKKVTSKKDGSEGERIDLQARVKRPANIAAQKGRK